MASFAVVDCTRRYLGLLALVTRRYLRLAALGTKMFLRLAALVMEMYQGLAALVTRRYSGAASPRYIGLADYRLQLTAVNHTCPEAKTQFIELFMDTINGFLLLLSHIKNIDKA